MGDNTPPSRERIAEFVRAYQASNNSAPTASDMCGIPRATGYRWARLYAHDSAILEAAEAGGIEDPSIIADFWKIVKDEDGNGHSIRIKNPNTNEEMSFSDMVRESIAEALQDKAPKFQARKKQPSGEHLLVVDLADVHFRKLCVETETGHEYNLDVARHRVIEGTKALLRLAKPMGIGKVLFVLGNDALHTDNAQNTTTSGTRQDTVGTVFEGFRVAQSSLIDAIKLCTKVADVDLLHNMSNHDWTNGWMLSQTIAGVLANHTNVHSSDYNLSERHRKYYRFENNLFGISHGDGAKEEALYGTMVKEAREHISECPNLYWLLHHFHHAMRRTRGAQKPFLREKDHNGMTAIITGHNHVEGEDLNIQYVRSPSPPDGWHDRNGYLNRQGVECFVYHPYDGLKARFTEWF